MDLKYTDVREFIYNLLGLIETRFVQTEPESLSKFADLVTVSVSLGDSCVQTFSVSPTKIFTSRSG